MFQSGDGRPIAWRRIVIGADGAVWAAADEGLVRFDGTRWATAVNDGAWSGSWSPLILAPDGTVFINGPSGLARLEGAGG